MATMANYSQRGGSTGIRQKEHFESGVSLKAELQEAEVCSLENVSARVLRLRVTGHRLAQPPPSTSVLADKPSNNVMFLLISVFTRPSSAFEVGLCLRKSFFPPNCTLRPHRSHTHQDQLLNTPNQDVCPDNRKSIHCRPWYPKIISQWFVWGGKIRDHCKHAETGFFLIWLTQGNSLQTKERNGRYEFHGRWSGYAVEPIKWAILARLTTFAFRMSL